MNDTQNWYIIKHQDGHCEIQPSDRVEGQGDSSVLERWGPFDSQDEALARRVGLIRAGKCQPV